MTLIICFNPDVYPVLCSDALASSSAGSEAVVLPTIVDKARGFRSKHNLVAHSLIDKFIVLSDYIFTAWAGSSAVVFPFLNEIRLKFRNDPLSIDDLFDFVQKQFREIKPRPCFLFLVKDQLGRTGVAEFGCKKCFSPAVGNFWIGGTGARRAEQIIKQIPNKLPQAENELTQALETVLTVA